MEGYTQDLTKNKKILTIRLTKAKQTQGLMQVLTLSILISKNYLAILLQRSLNGWILIFIKGTFMCMARSMKETLEIKIFHYSLIWILLIPLLLMPRVGKKN